MSTKHPQTFLHGIFSFHLARNPCWLGTVLDDNLDLLQPFNKALFSPNKNVPTHISRVFFRLFLLISNSNKREF